MRNFTQFRPFEEYWGDSTLDRHHGSYLRSCYLTVFRAADARYDVRGSVLAELVKSCLTNRSRIQSSLKTRISGYVQPEALAYVEALTVSLLYGPSGRFSPHEYFYLSKPSDLSDQIRFGPCSSTYCKHLAASAKLDITDAHEFLSATRPN